MYARVVLLVAGAAMVQAQTQTDAQAREFFENRIRPVLARSCYPCHSSDSKTAMGGLRLDSKAGVLRGGTSGPAVVAGKPDESPLVRAVRYEGRKMPPSGKLPDNVVADIEKWVRMGAPDPRAGAAASAQASAIDIEKGRAFWAFRPPAKPAVPKVKNAKWVLDPIDRFVLKGLEQKKLAPTADADRATWLRRVTFDLTGLPPTPEEVTAFAADRSRNAYEKVVDRLLGSERFGERWARHWLDVARYADSVGRGRNFAFPFAWRYRNWVIDAFNADLPYDLFVKEQLAGDLMPAKDERERNDRMVATGFLTLGSHDLVERDPAQFRMDVVDEQINATTRGFMALTVGCARCHDHKFDPIPTSDYYALAGIFRSTEMLSGLQRRPRDNASYFNVALLAKVNPGQAAPPSGHLADPAKQQRWDELWSELREMQEPPRRNRKKGPALTGNRLRDEARRILLELDKFPLPPDLAMAAKEGKPGDCEILIKGEVKDLGPVVPRGFVQVVSARGAPSIDPKHSGRLELAEWIASRENPLTARVAVNRIWHHLFGRGLVSTVDNFGVTGEKPTHPELLDYLALRFANEGWSVKKTLRAIVLSRTYRMSAAYNAKNAEIDPDNRMLWRMNRRRLEVEAIRDALLMASGRLDLQRPEGSPVLEFRRSAEVNRGVRGRVGDYATELKVRSVYVPVLRNALPSMYETFDFPEPSETKGEREVTTVATQALFLMNSPWVMEQARAAAARLAKSGIAGEKERIERAYREVLGRAPTAAETGRALEYVKGESWARFYQSLFASAEFRYRS